MKVFLITAVSLWLGLVATAIHGSIHHKGPGDHPYNVIVLAFFVLMVLAIAAIGITQVLR